MDICLNITKLLFQHDCVVLPGFGGFVTNYVPSGISDQDVFSPPRKIVAFNRNLKNDDGLLISSISKIYHIPYSETKSRLIDFVNDVINQLNLTGKIVFEGIGDFKMDENEILQFNPLASANYLADSYGLADFHFPKLKNNALTGRFPESFKDKESIKPSLRIVSIKKIAIAASFIIVLAFLPGNRNLLKNFRVESGSLGFHTNSIQPLMTSDNESSNRGKHITAKLTVSKKEIDSTVISKPERVIKSETGIDMDSEFQIIAGCFKSETNAQNFVNSLKTKGINSSIVNYSNGLYKVSVGSFDSKADALQLINSLHISNPGIDVWLLGK